MTFGIKKKKKPWSLISSVCSHLEKNTDKKQQVWMGVAVDPHQILNAGVVGGGSFINSAAQTH